MISLAGAEVHGLRAVVALRGEDDPLGRVVDVEELAGRRARPPDLDVVRPGSRGLHALPDQRRDDVRTRRIEVVARPVEVHREQVDRVEAVLLRGTPGPGPAASSWPGRTGRSSPPGSRSRGRLPGTGTGVNFGYAQTVPIVTNFSTPASRACSMSWMPMIALS